MNENNTIEVKWQNEDELEKRLTREEYDLILPLSKVDTVRLFPYIEVNGFKYYLRDKLY